MARVIQTAGQEANKQIPNKDRIAAQSKGVSKSSNPKKSKKMSY